MRTAVCGLGRMGAAFAAALAAAGDVPAVWNRTPRAPGILAVPAATPAAAAAGADAIVVAVFDGPAAEAVLLGPDGVAEGARPGALVINATTLAPDESRELAARVTGAGLRYAEAPVIGSVPAARAGTLTVLTGGAEADVRDAEPVLTAWSHAGTRRHAGPVGAASALKLVANLGLGAAVAALHDAVRLGEALGVARADVLDVLQGGVTGPLVAAKRPRLDRDDPDAYAAADFTVAALAKDLALAVSAAGTPLPAADAAYRLIAGFAARDGGGTVDISALGRGG
ncbi:NAD(P)-binding domain-containing protein [Streptomyces sp. NPDC006798]|uniref:NAD(P)-dependent oxidoreductase n=1 Tax=Streptomyces sp. NPDC006798 TaxID=3155462 RepID=UPI0033D2D603